MGELFAVREDEWEASLRRMGFFLGKFIYIMDAYEDLEKDEKKGCYNPLLPLKDREDFEDYVKQILLPCIENVSVMRNILYSGVWTKYNAVQAKKKEEAVNE